MKKEQLKHIKNKWCRRLTGSGIREIDEPIYAAGEKSIRHMASVYQETMVTGMPDGEGRDIWPELNPKEDSGHISQVFVRLKVMAQAYCTEMCGETCGKEDLYQSVVEGLSRMRPYYRKGLGVRGNWWCFDIGGAHALNDTLLLLEDRLRETEEGRQLIRHYLEATAYYVAIPEEARTADPDHPLPMTGANLTDTAMVCLIRGLLSADLKDIENAANAAKTVLPYVTGGDGFYEDGSFIQHKVIPYAGGYGPDLIRSFENLVYLLNDTDETIKNAEGFDHVSGWIREAYLPLFKDGEIMDMVRGRKSSRFDDTAHRAGRNVLATLLLLAEYTTDCVRAEIRGEIKGLLKRDHVCRDILYKDLQAYQAEILKNLMDGEETASGQPVFYKNYGNMDRVVQHREKYSLGISMFSSRIGRFTFGNDENREGHHASDGMLYLYTDDAFQFGDGFWPTVDPMRLPGITSDHLRPTVKAWFDNRNTKDWVGGSQVGGLYGSAGMDMEMKQLQYPDGSIVKAEPSDLTGKKSWFVFEDTIICLGAGISCTKSDNVETIAENRKTDGTGRLLSPEGEIKLTEGVTACVRQPWLVLEDNRTGQHRSEPIGYYFPELPEVTVLKEKRTGAWSDINGSGPTELIQRNYISIAFRHGANPQNASYAYVLLPGKDAADMISYAKSKPVTIIANTGEIQAAEDKASGLCGMNFWSAGRVRGIEAKTPCSVTELMIRGKEDEKVLLGISDPTHKQDKITIILEGDYIPLGEQEPDIKVIHLDGKTEITADTGKKDGASHQVSLRCSDNSFWQAQF